MNGERYLRVTVHQLAAERGNVCPPRTDALWSNQIDNRED